MSQVMILISDREDGAVDASVSYELKGKRPRSAAEHLAKYIMDYIRLNSTEGKPNDKARRN